MYFRTAFTGACVVFALCLAAAAPVQADAMQACGARYQAAAAAGTLGGMKWADFKRAQCADLPADTPALPEATIVADTATPPPAKTVAASAPSAVAPVLPKGIDAKYASEKPSLARLHTCRDQYKLDKASNGLGGLRWIQKGGGFYSQCNAALKAH